jgi:hypothetical protein
MTKDKDLDLGDMDDFDDFDDFNENDREPGTTSYGKKQIVEDAAQFTKVLAQKTSKKLLPTEYAEGMDKMVEYKDYMSEIATKSKTKISKELGRLNKEVKKALPAKLKGLSDKLDAFLGTNETEADAQAGVEEQRNTFIQGTISGLFDKQLEAQATLQADADAKTEVSDKLNLVQTKKTHELLMEIANSTTNTHNFSVGIAKEYYKKSLEIQYRSYYIQADMLETMRNYYKTFTSQFDVIGKNTALPEFVKLKQTERLKEFTRNKLMESVYDKTLGKNEYVEGLKKNFATFIGDKVDSLTEGISNMTSGIGMLNEMGEAGMSTGSLVKDLAMDAGADYASDKISDKYKDKFANNKHVKAGKGFLSSMIKSPEVFFNTMAGKANKRLGKIDQESDNPFVGSITNTLSSLLDVFKPKGLDMKVENESVLTNKQPAIFDGNVYRSITDVIPMYLRKILQTNTNLTGMYLQTNSAKLKDFKFSEELHFDYTNRKLDTLANVKSSVQSELAELTSKTTVSNVVESMGIGKKMSAKEKERMTKYVEHASGVLDAKDITADNLLEQYGNNDQLKSYVDKDPVLQEYIKSLTHTKNRAYKKVKGGIDYRLRQINDKDNVELVQQLLNSILHHNGDNSMIDFTVELTEPIVDSFKKYIVKDGGVLTEDNMVTFKPFFYIPVDKKDKIVPIVNALVKKIYSVISDGKFADKSMLISTLSTLDRAIRDSDIINPELIKTLRDYNRDLVDVTKKNGHMYIDVSNVTSLKIKDDDTTIDADEFQVDTSVNNEGKALDEFTAKVVDAFKSGRDKTAAVTEQIKKDIGSLRNFEDVKKLTAKYSDVIKTKSNEVFSKSRNDIAKRLDQIETFVTSSSEFKNLEKNVSEYSDTIKEKVHTALDAMKIRLEEALAQKTSESVQYETLKATLMAKEGISQSDKDKEIKDIERKIRLVTLEVFALRKARGMLDHKVEITGTVKTYTQRLRAYLATMKEAIDSELANLQATD